MSFRSQLNEFYKNIDDKANYIRDILVKNGFIAAKSYLNGHYNKDYNGKYVRDYYPIPVIEVKGLCNIELVVTRINISTKTSLKNAVHFNYNKFSEYYYEVYGVINYLADYYKSGENIVKLYKNLEECNEKEIGFGFSFANNTAIDKILKLVILFRDFGFYY